MLRESEMEKAAERAGQSWTCSYKSHQQRIVLQFPDRVDGLMLINTLVTAAGWFEWGYNKRNVRHMTQIGMTPVRKNC